MKNPIMDTITEFSELQAYSNAQSKTIIELSKKMKEKDDEINHLRKLLEGSVPIIRQSSDITKFDSNDQEFICRTEINRLKDVSFDRELTLEECRKLDIYSKVLKELQNSPRTIEVKSRATEAELLAIVTKNK